MFRRNFFLYFAWGIFTSVLGVVFGPGLVRYLYPRVLYEPSSVFTAGFPDEYPAGSVSEKYKKDGVWIVRREDGVFYAVLTTCTHLGCTPRWLGSESKFKCPCHGSGFDRDGINYEGPAPRPLERAKITLAENGLIEIDKSVKFLGEKGQWEDTGALLKV